MNFKYTAMTLPQIYQPNVSALSSTLINAAIMITIALAAGCTSTNSQTPDKFDTSQLVWPLPPETPRIKYFGVLFNENQVIPPESALSSIRDKLLGKPSKGGRGLRKPSAVHVDAWGRIFVADNGWGKVLVFDKPNQSFDIWGTSSRGMLTKPLGVTSDSQGRVYVTDSVAQRAVVYDREGKFLYAMGKAGEMERPIGIAVDETRGSIYIVDTKAHQILVYDMQGTLIKRIGKRGPNPGEFNFPTHIVLDKSGRIYVSDSMNFRVQILEADGSVYNTFGSNGDGRGQFVRPKGIALDSDGNIYVADGAFNNFQVFNRQGELLLDVGSHGRLPGQFIIPAGVYIDENDKIYVADQYNFRIQMFQYLDQNPENGMNKKNPDKPFNKEEITALDS